MIDWRALTEFEGFANEEMMLIELHRSFSINKIAKRFSMDPSTVKTRMKKWNITLRSRGGHNNTSKFELVLHRFDQRWFTTVNCYRLRRYVKISYEVLRAYVRRKGRYGICDNKPSRRPQPIRDDEQDSLDPSTGEE